MNPELNAVHVLHGPEAGVHLPSLEAWCRTSSVQWGIEVSVDAFPNGGALSQALGDALDASATSVVLVAGACAGAVLDQACAAPRERLIWMELETVHGPPDRQLAEAGVRTVRGRGIDGYRWALRSLIEHAAWPLRTVKYGPGRDHAADLRLPAPAGGPWPVLALIHGGAWGATWERDLMDALAVDLARCGYATWNVEYRRLNEGGGWPQTFLDVAASFDALATIDAALDLKRVGIVGHSAGGHLALWLAARRQLPPGAIGADPALHPAFVLSLAGLPDLIDSARRGVYDRAAERLVGGGVAEMEDRFAIASPHRWLPLEVPQLLVHGTADVPDNVDMNRLYAERARASGDDVSLVELPGIDHFAIIEPRSVAWRAIRGELQHHFPADGASFPTPEES